MRKKERSYEEVVNENRLERLVTSKTYQKILNYSFEHAYWEAKLANLKMYGDSFIDLCFYRRAEYIHTWLGEAEKLRPGEELELPRLHDDDFIKMVKWEFAYVRKAKRRKE